jgi:hypothetical protein
MNSVARVIAVVFVLVAAPVCAQNWPTKPVRLIVGFAPGGSTDIVARLIAQEMGKNIGQQVVVENRPGAGSAIAAELTAKSPPDGHTIRVHDGRVRDHAVPVFQTGRNHEKDLIGDADRLAALHHRPASVAAGAKREGVHRAGQGAARPDHLRVLRHRDGIAPVGGVFPNAAKLDFARAVQRARATPWPISSPARWC